MTGVTSSAGESQIKQIYFIRRISGFRTSSEEFCAFRLFEWKIPQESSSSGITLSI